MNWFNQHVIDAHRQRRRQGRGGRSPTPPTSTSTRRVVDGAVNGAGAVTEGTGEALRPVQSGKVSQYGALLFGAAAIGALILVIVV